MRLSEYLYIEFAVVKCMRIKILFAFIKDVFADFKLKII